VVYHKTGGNNKYYKKPEYALKWNKEAVEKYRMLNGLEKYRKRQGFLISGVCSNLSARLAYKGALWESNKAMCFFPKNPKRYSAYFFIGLLNSKPYNQMIKIINHTNSIQIRDIKKLPFFNFSSKDITQVVKLTKEIIKNIKEKNDYNFSEKQEKINSIVYKYIRA